MEPVNWTPAQNLAWNWVESAVNQGLSATRALKAYRSEGGSIRTQDWFSLWNEYKSGTEVWGNYKYYSVNETIPESMFSRVDINYREKYVMNVKVLIKESTGNVVEKWRTIESSKRLTVGEWQQAMRDSIATEAYEYDQEVIDTLDQVFFVRSGGGEYV